MKTTFDIYMEIQQQEYPNKNNYTLPDDYELKAMEAYADQFKHLQPANNDYAVKVLSDELQKYKEIQAETDINNDYEKARVEEGINLLSRLLTKFTPNN
jgi:hypothetical protein